MHGDHVSRSSKPLHKNGAYHALGSMVVPSALIRPLTVLVAAAVVAAVASEAATDVEVVVATAAAAAAVSLLLHDQTFS